MATVETFALQGGKPTILKDPDAILDYTLDWTAWLGTDTITTAIWVLDPTLIQVSMTFSTTKATIFIGGGVAGTKCPATCRITTAGGRVDDRTIVLKITQR